MFSLCIPTMDRFDSFLKKNLTEYINNPYINEIVVSDENGNDIKKIKEVFKSPKLVLIKNEKILGPFLNKINVCKRAKNEWIVLMDSDNFADHNYFAVAKNYITNNIKNEKNIILAPSKAKPKFDYSHLAGLIYKNGNFKSNALIEKNKKTNIHSGSNVLMNTGNYVINKYLINNLNIQNEKKNIDKSSSCDVIYMNTLFFEQLDLNMHVVKDLEYDHVVHDGSIYLKTYRKSEITEFANCVHKRYEELLKN